MRVKKSKFTRIKYIQPGEWLVYNLVSGSECILDDQEVEILSNAINQEYDVIPTLLKDLLKMGIAIQEDIDENACLELERKISLYSFATNEVGFVIAPTMDCNARCFYCYENDTRCVCYMNEQIQEQLVNYIKKTVEGKKKLFISWFGGEPLLCKDLISKVSSNLISFCKQNKIEYYSELTTNGYFLNEFIDGLTENMIMDTQITLDGFKEEYEKRKRYNNCEDAWEKVIDNLFDASVLGNHITIRFNFDKNNIHSIKQCVKFLINNPRWNKNITIYFYPLEPNCQDIQSDNSSFFIESEYENIITELYEYLYQCGYYNDREYALDFRKLSLPCYGATMGILAVDYEGNLYQCQHILCKKQYAIGNVSLGVPITQSLLQWYDGKVSQKCEECEILPLCQGGCITKPKTGQDSYVCHMMKYRLKIQENLKVRLYTKENFLTLHSLKGGESNESN